MSVPSAIAACFDVPWESCPAGDRYQVAHITFSPELLLCRQIPRHVGKKFRVDLWRAAVLGPCICASNRGIAKPMLTSPHCCKALVMMAAASVLNSLDVQDQRKSWDGVSLH